MDIKEYQVKTDSQKVNHSWEDARFKVAFDIIEKQIINKIENKDKAAITIFDIGCGDGYFLEKLAKKLPNAQCLAIDTAFDDEIIQNFQEKYKSFNIKFYKSIESIDLQNVKADIVLLLDVIEHIEDDVEFLKSLYNSSFITEKSKIVITVPAFQSLFCSHDTWLGHYRRYTVNSLQKHLLEAGFRSKLDGYFFFSLLIPRWLQVKKEKKKKRDIDKVTGIGDWQGNSLTFKLIVTILYLDYLFSKVLRFFRIKIIGLSCYSIGQKQ